MSPAASTASKTSAKKADLKLSTSARPGSRMAIEISVPADRTQGSHNDAVEKLSRSVKLPGFRQGKVPRTVLMQQIGPMRIRATALESLVDSVFRDALKQAEIPAIGQPALDGGFEALLERFEPGKELTLTLEM
ncbi:MAG: trigger factor family protein, partial [Vulcanococcus sp.]